MVLCRLKASYQIPFSWPYNIRRYQQALEPLEVLALLDLGLGSLELRAFGPGEFEFRFIGSTVTAVDCRLRFFQPWTRVPLHDL